MKCDIIGHMDKRCLRIIFVRLTAVFAAAVISLSLFSCKDKPSAPVSEELPSAAEICAAYNDNVVEISCGNTYGTGIVLVNDGESVVIATCYHVTGYDAGAVEFRFAGSDEFIGGAETIGYDLQFDVAFFRLAVKSRAKDLLNSSAGFAGLKFVLPETGDSVVVMGNADGRGIAAFDGIVSVPEEIELAEGYYKPLTRVTADMNPGCSGALAAGADGRVIGMGVGRRKSTADGSALSGMSYVLPSGIIAALLNKALDNPANSAITRPDFSFKRDEITENNVTEKRITVAFDYGGRSASFIWTPGQLTLLSASGVAAENGSVYTSINGVQIAETVSDTAAAVIAMDVGELRFGGDTSLIL